MLALRARHVGWLGRVVATTSWPVRVRPLSCAVAMSLAFAVAARGEEVVRVGGTGTALGAMTRLGEAFRASNAEIRVAVLPSLGTSGAVAAVSQGALDVGVIGRPLEARERDLGLVAFEFARTPFVFAAGPRAGVSGITGEEAVRIYRGETVTWPNGERIRLVLRPAGDSDTQLLKAISREMAAAVDMALARPGMLMAITNQECNEVLARTPGALGPTTLLQVRSEPRSVSVLTWNGVTPNVENMAAGAYPLTKPLTIVIQRSPRPAVRRVVSFLASANGRKVLQDLGAQTVAFPPID